MLGKFKKFAVIWFYFLLLLLAFQLSFALSFFLNQNAEASRTICSPDQNIIDQLADLSPASNAEIILSESRTHNCAEKAVDLKLRYQGSLIGFIREDDRVTEFLSARNIETIKKSVRNEPNTSISAVYGFVFALIIVIVFLLRQQKNGKFITQPVSSTSLKVTTATVAACIAGLIILVWLPFQLFTEHIQIPNYLVLNTEELQLGATVWIFFVLLAPFTEEIIFRAWLLEAWRKVIGAPLALILSSVAFSVVHPMGVVANLIFIIPGLLLGALWLKTRSLTACVIAHSAYNAFVLTMLTTTT